MPRTLPPAYLDRQIKRWEVQARQFFGRAELSRRRAELLDLRGKQALAKAEFYRGVARLQGLTMSEQASNVNTMEHSLAHRIASSKAKSSDALVKTANLAGFTLRTLCEHPQVDMSLAALSMARVKVGTLNREGLKKWRPIPESKAIAIEKLTGFEASPENWPAGVLKGK